jgi:uncharacterized repeat protein (TIGR01451 family)
MRFSIFGCFPTKTIPAALVAMSMLGLGVSAAPAFAEPEVPWWHVNAYSRPSNLKPGGTGNVIIAVTNLGDALAQGAGAPIVVTDTLPEGVSASSAQYFANNAAFGGFGSSLAEEVPCSVSGSRVVRCEFAGIMPPYARLEVKIKAEVSGTLAEGRYPDVVSVSGGGAADVSVGDKATELTVSSAPTPFGVEAYELTPESANGSLETQAGAHPFQLTSTIVLNQDAETARLEDDQVGEVVPPVPVKDLSAELPPGLVGNPTPFPRCPEEEFFKQECPADTQVGVVVLTISEPLQNAFPVGIYNVPPAPGEPARFGFVAPASTDVFLDTSVGSGSDYAITVSSDNISETAMTLAAQLTFWGVPGDARHDRSRGYACIEAAYEVSPGECPTDTVGAPFLALPTACGNPSREPFQSSIASDSWYEPGRPSVEGQRGGYTLGDSSDPSIAMDGCNELSFEPSIRVTPDVTSASSPSGVNVDVHVPQKEELIASGDAESAVKDITVALPEGVAVNPAGGDGLAACPEAESAGGVGFSGLTELPDVPGISATFTSKLPDPLEQGVNFCPNASKIGEVTIHTPLLPNPLKGFVYLASQNKNPFGSLVAIYVVAEDPVSGTVLKLAGDVHLTDTGQLVTTFENSPELPFEDAELHFFGGERAPLATPARCGTYAATSSVVPWSGSAPSTPSSTFNITSGPNGSPCPGASLPFSPSLTGGTINNNGGAFSALSTTIGREDGQQNMSSVKLHFPPGLSGLLSGVALCDEAQANAGTCGPNSLIGETTVSAGVGSDPVSVTGGEVYITEKYHGAPFGLSIVNPVKAGPFDLEHDTSNPAQDPSCDCIVVRAKIEVDPSTAALTVTTNNEDEGYAIPHLIDGIPVQIKKVNVLINRPGFAFNPTSCAPMKITGAIQSDEGASSNVEVPFQVANCAILKFAPKFAVSTSAKTSKADGASLAVKLTYPNARQGTQANIAKVKVDLPKQLPSRLTTLQKACTAAQFEANPAGCPSASFIGHAKVITPLIPVPLEGPAIFVSHGGEAFPSLIMVLQGYGVRIDLVGTTFISKAGITSSTFKAVPDAPVGSFELTLPEGKYSALGTNKNLCTQKLAMPTAFLAQNGAEIHETTKVSVTGCPRAKKEGKKRRKGKAKRTKRK